MQQVALTVRAQHAQRRGVALKHNGQLSAQQGLNLLSLIHACNQQGESLAGIRDGNPSWMLDPQQGLNLLSLIHASPS